MADYRIELGVKLKDNAIQDEINEAQRTLKPIEIKVDAETKELTNTIKEALNSLSKGTKNALTLDTSKIESALGEVANEIKIIKSSIGTLDGGDMKSLLATINQMNTALDKASNQFVELNKSLDALSRKDFSLDIGIKLGGSNSVINNSLYGDFVKDDVLPTLKKQEQALTKYLAQYFNTNEFSAVDKLLSKSDNGLGGVGGVIEIMDKLESPLKKSESLKDRMREYKNFINAIISSANMQGIDLSPVLSQFEKLPNELIETADNIRNGTKQVDESVDKLKSIFGGGIDVEGLSSALQPIITDLREIKEALQDLSKSVSLDGLTSSFDRLSETLEKLMTNAKLVQDVLGNGKMAVVDTDTGEVKEIQEVIENKKTESRQAQETADAIVQSEKRKQQAYRETNRLISDSAKEAIDSVGSQSIYKSFEVDESDSIKFRREMESLVSQWTNAKGKLTDIKIDTTTVFDKDTGRNIEKIRQAQVTYNNELGETIKKTIALRQIGTEVKVVDGKEMASPIQGFVEVSGQYSKSLGKTKVQTDAFVKQQKQAVSNLTNQINQLNRAASDQNASRPIKDSSHLDILSSKYEEIISAIQRLKSASTDTFVDEQNNVKALISDFKSLVSEYKNAENVSTKMKGTDFTSGLDIAKNDLEKFKAQARDFPKITATIEELDRAIESVGDAASLNKFNDQLRVARSELAKIKSETSATNRSEKVGINISGLESKISDLQRISPEINKFEAEIDGAKVSVRSLLNDLGKVKTQGDFSVVNSRFKAFADSAKAAGIAVAETVGKAKSIKDIKFDIGTGKFDAQIVEVANGFDKLSLKSDDIRADIEKLKQLLSNMQTAAAVDDIDALKNAYKEYERILESVNNQISINTTKQQEANRQRVQTNNDDALIEAKKSLRWDIDNYLKNNTAAAKQFASTIKEIRAAIDTCDDSSALKNLKSQFDNVKREANFTLKSTQTFGDKIKKQWQQYSTYLGVASIFQYAEQGLRSMFEQVKLIDSAMTELKKVTNETDEAYNRFLTNAATRSREIGTTIDGLVSSTADFARLGYGFEDAQGLAEVANIYAVVGDEINGVEGATESLISTMAAFKDEMNGMSNTDFAMSIIDKFNEIGNNFAISSGGIGEALERSASSLMAANNTIDESIALITSANQVVQNPESVGNALKTISMRIRGAKTEMEEMGEDTEGMVDSTAKLREEIMALSGVDIMISPTEFKSTYQIMDELAQKWEDLTDIQQAKCLPDNVEIH